MIILNTFEITVGVIKLSFILSIKQNNIFKKNYILKMTIFNIKLSLINIKIKEIKLLTGFCQNWVSLIQSLIFYTLYIGGYIISFKYMSVKLFLVAEVLRYF